MTFGPATNAASAADERPGPHRDSVERSGSSRCSFRHRPCEEVPWLPRQHEDDFTTFVGLPNGGGSPAAARDSPVAVGCSVRRPHSTPDRQMVHADINVLAEHIATHAEPPSLLFSRHVRAPGFREEPMSARRPAKQIWFAIDVLEPGGDDRVLEFREAFAAHLSPHHFPVGVGTQTIPGRRRFAGRFVPGYRLYSVLVSKEILERVLGKQIERTQPRTEAVTV